MAITSLVNTEDFRRTATPFQPPHYNILGWHEKGLLPIWENSHIIKIYFIITLNLNSLKTLFDNSEYEELKNILIAEYGFEKQVPILEMLKNSNEKIASLAEYIYKKILL